MRDGFESLWLARGCAISSTHEGDHGPVVTIRRSGHTSPTEGMTLRLEITRLRGRPRLVIENADWLAEAFFALDPSGKAGGFDDKALESARTRIESKDVDAINGTMRARSPQKAWAAVKDQELPWLAGISLNWDLGDLNPSEWRDQVAPALEAAFDALIQKGRGVSVSTKMLHLKRPRLVPVLDSLVVEQLGAAMPSTPARAVALIGHVREVAQQNRETLDRIIDYLGAQGMDRSAVRVLDALLWGSHRDSWIAPLAPVIVRWRRNRREGHSS